MSREPIRILCIDDHAFVVEGLAARFSIESDLELVGRLESADDLLEEVDRTRAQIVLMDLEMPGTDPFQAIDELRRTRPHVKTLVLSAYVRDRYIDSAFQAGAWGYLSKTDTPEDVIAGIRKVAAGEAVWSTLVLERARPEGTEQHPKAGSRLGLLTRREQQILRMIARGMSRTAIAEELSRSPMTVDNHRKSIMKKLDINDRAELVRYAIAEGLVEV